MFDERLQQRFTDFKSAFSALEGGLAVPLWGGAIKMKVFVLYLIIISFLCFGTAKAEKPFLTEGNCSAAYRYYFLNRALAFEDNFGAQIMLQQGADPNGRDYEVNCVGGMEPDTPLSMATGMENLEMIKILLDAGADPNILVAEGITPLLQAVESERIDIVEILLKKGANPVLEGLYKKPLHVAKEKNNQSLIRLIEKYTKEN